MRTNETMTTRRVDNEMAAELNRIFGQQFMADAEKAYNDIFGDIMKKTENLK
jgi:hypothetical protein